MSLRRLGDYIEEYSKKNRNDEPYPVYSVTNSQGFCTEYFDKDVSGQDKTNYKIVPRGCFAYNPSRINVGSVDWQDCEDNVIVSPLYVVFKCSKELNPDYLKYFLKSREGKRLIEANNSGSVRNNLKYDVLSRFEFNIVELDEQNVVVANLKEIEAAIENERKQINLYDELIKARFIEMFGNPIYNDKTWEVDRVERICKEIYGGGTPSKSHPEYYEAGDIPWVTSKDVKTDVLTDSQIHINQSGVDNSTARIVPANSVIMVIRSGILKHTLPVAINTVPITVNQDLKVFIPSEKVVARFLAVQFKMQEENILSGVRAVTADNIEFNTLKQRLMIVPPLDLQNEFVIFCNQIDQLKSVARERLCLYEELLEKKISDYFIC